MSVAAQGPNGLPEDAAAPVDAAFLDAHPLWRADAYAREALDLAHALLGQVLVRGDVALAITEVEAYRHPDDTANHCRMGRTPRNAPMWGPPGHAYIYLCYGVHSMLNVVSDRDGAGAAVLIRAARPVRGLEVLAERRGGRRGPDALTGPGKVGQALDLSPAMSGLALFEPGGLELRRGPGVAAVARGPRVGIGYAEPAHRDAPWRLAEVGSRWVSRRRELVSD